MPVICDLNEVPVPYYDLADIAIRAGIGKQAGEWHYCAFERESTTDWVIELTWPSGFSWRRLFSGPDEQTKKFIENAISRAVAIADRIEAEGRAALAEPSSQGEFTKHPECMVPFTMSSEELRFAREYGRWLATAR